jgi:hypothetical protein
MRWALIREVTEQVPQAAFRPVAMEETLNA